MQRTIKLKTFLPYPLEFVWQALTDARMLGGWFMENDLIPQPGHRFTFRMAPQKGWDGITHCEIIAVESPTYLAYSYRGEATGEKVLACAGIHSDTTDGLTKGIFTQLDTQVSFRLEPTCGGTVLAFTQSGYQGLKLVLISLIMEMGWKKQSTRKLPKVLAQVV